VLLHDNAYLHTAAHAVVTLKKINYEVLEHPPYSPEPTTEENGACVVYLSAKKLFFFSGREED
jgi:hypothetical protein